MQSGYGELAVRRFPHGVRLIEWRIVIRINLTNYNVAPTGWERFGQWGRFASAADRCARCFKNLLSLSA